MDRPSTAAERWERFAREDPLYFIETDPRLRGDLDEFLTSGRALADWAMEVAGDGLGRGAALEIGCGMGRNAIGLARHFDRVDGIDVAPTMLERAAAVDPPPNVHLGLTAGHGTLDFASGELDLVFSHLVFQHVADERVLAHYLTETARVLAPGGRALLQFDTRAPTAALRLAHALPDRLLPRRLRRGVRRIRRRPERIDALAAAAGLVARRELGRGTAEHWLLLEPAA